MRPGKTSTVHGCLVRLVSCGWPDTTTTDKEKHSALLQSCFFFVFFCLFVFASLFFFAFFFALFFVFCLPYFLSFFFCFFCLFFSLFAHICRKIPHLGERGTPALAQTIASLPLRQGGLGLRNIVRLRGAAFWSSWADCLKMVHKRHPAVCGSIVASLRRDDEFPFVHALGQSDTEVRSAGLVARTWEDLVIDKEEEDDAEFDPNLPRRRWQQKVAECVDTQFVATNVWPILTNQEKALMRSQTGPLSSLPFTVLPTVSRGLTRSLSVCFSFNVCTFPPPHRTSVPMWPSTRCLWPSSLCVCCCRGFLGEGTTRWRLLGSVEKQVLVCDSTPW